ncbi:MAG: trimethylamine corrinoid protein 2 [Armatimonadota bacterium]
MMPIEQLPDWEMRLARQDAFWAREIIDRPVICMALPKEKPVVPRPAAKTHASHRERWLDFSYTAEHTLANVLNTDYLGDALPGISPNLGPEIFSAFFGCDMEFGENTSWSIPLLEDWSDVERVKFTEDNFYWRKLLELTDTLLEAGKGHFYTGLTDFHPGGDALAAFRDPLNLNIDMLEAPEAVKALLAYTYPVYFKVFDACYARLKAAGQAITSWPGIVSSKKWYVPSNDFSCMISKEMFDEVFLPGIREECRQLEASIYHLDGPNALRHLDSLLDIPELNAIQWVYGAGHGRASDWLPVYHQCQAAGKGLQLNLEADELDLFMEELHPEGLWINVGGVQSREQAEGVLKKVGQWR